MELVSARGNYMGWGAVLHLTAYLRGLRTELHARLLGRRIRLSFHMFDAIQYVSKKNAQA